MLEPNMSLTGFGAECPAAARHEAGQARIGAGPLAGRRHRDASSASPRLLPPGSDVKDYHDDETILGIFVETIKRFSALQFQRVRIF
jgi:hypothetical protein